MSQLPPSHAALGAVGISYEQLVALYRLIQERASHATAAEILDFLKDDISSPKFSHLPPEQRARLQVSLRALQEYALEVWRFAPQAAALEAATQVGPYPGVSPSGAFQAVALTPSGAFPVVSISGSYPPVSPSGAYRALTPSGAYGAVSGGYPAAGATGAFPAVSKRRGVFGRVREALRTLFGKAPEPAQPPALGSDIAAMLAAGE